MTVLPEGPLWDTYPSTIYLSIYLPDDRKLDDDGGEDDESGYNGGP